MKIVLIYRPKRAGVYSIEELFHTIALELSAHAEVIEYETGGPRKMLRDIYNLRKLKADVYHITGAEHYLAFLLPRFKTVLTIHDLGHYLYTLHGLRRWIYKWVWLLGPVHAATAVTTISELTLGHLAELCGKADRKISVVHNCVSRSFQFSPLPLRSDLPLILQVGTGPNKNLHRLVDALIEVPCKLVLVGHLTPDIKDHLSRNCQAYDNYFNLTQEQLAELYQQCDLVSFVSTNEGFGMPILEAQATGRPIVTSCISPMTDVASDGACFVDPFDIPGIRIGVERVLKDPDYRASLVAKGRTNVLRFIPSAIAGIYFGIYSKIAS
jgi:glycosyltransferase involved in cell wall biosynthesis